MSTEPSPRYLESVEDVPASGPDPYSKRDKGRAVRLAEAQLESDVNDGDIIPSDEVSDIHREAVRLYASHRLALDPKSPDSMTMGEMADEGAGRMAYADRMLALYDRAITSITGSTGTGTGGEGGSVGDDGEYSPPTLSGGGHIHID